MDDPADSRPSRPPSLRKAPPRSASAPRRAASPASPRPRAPGRDLSTPPPAVPKLRSNTAMRSGIDGSRLRQALRTSAAGKLAACLSGSDSAADRRVRLRRGASAPPDRTRTRQDRRGLRPAARGWRGPAGRRGRPAPPAAPPRWQAETAERRVRRHAFEQPAGLGRIVAQQSLDDEPRRSERRTRGIAASSVFDFARGFARRQIPPGRARRMSGGDPLDARRRVAGGPRQRNGCARYSAAQIGQRAPLLRLDGVSPDISQGLGQRLLMLALGNQAGEQKQRLPDGAARRKSHCQIRSRPP